MRKKSPRNSISRREFLGGLAGSAAAGLASGCQGRKPTLPENAPREAFIVPNFHPASCGWLTTFSKERVYCANTYLDHLDRVRDDPNYKFALSEITNIIAIMNFQSARIEEIKQRAKEGRVELVNANFLEMTVNLSGGEALIKEGVEGLRWQEQVMGIHPRLMWVIDICGQHNQMAQISAGLGLEAMIYERMNKTGSTIHWIESPDGSRILALCPDGYSSFSALFSTRERLNGDELRDLAQELADWAKKTPEGAPVLVLAGSGDYSQAPLRKEYPSEFLKQWEEVFPQTKIHIATASDYLDAILPGVKSGQYKLPIMQGGTGYTYDAFWIESPRVKTSYRRNEHGLQAAESISTIASLHSGFNYPTQSLYESWILMLLNMDRNTLWGSAGGMVFESETSWDVRDRMDYVEAGNKKIQAAALGAACPAGEGAALFNPLNWERNDPVVLDLPEGKVVEGAVCESGPEGKTLCRLRLPSLGVAGMGLEPKKAETPKKIELPESIETAHYTARIDPKTGALVSLKVKPSGREVLGGPANVIVAEKPKPQKEDYGDFMSWRPDRTRLASSSDFKPVITVSSGALATTVEVASEFYGGAPSRRVMRFYKDFPRIDFETELQDIPNITVVVAEFPLAADIEEVRRGVPCGFSHGAWAKPNPVLVGWTKGILPAVRWSHYSLEGGGGVAILDRGLTGRELNQRTPVIYLMNATDKYAGYPNAWLSGKGRHGLEYALVAHEGAWQARIPQMAWEYNCPPVLVTGRNAMAARSFVYTSNNVIVEVVRREGKDIEMRMVECLGLTGTAEVTLSLPHRGAALTDLRGRNPQPLPGIGPTYRFPVRPQQIVTVHFHAASPVEEIKPVTEWDKFVPEPKRAALHSYGHYLGHPPSGDQPQT